MEKKSRKKFFVIVAIVIIIVAIIGGVILLNTNNESSINTSVSNTSTYKIGDSVETDIIKLKLDTAQFAIALVNTNGKEYGKVKEYDASKDSKNPFVAAKGHTLVAFTFTVENLDRDYVNIGNSFNGKFTSVKYNGQTYNTKEKFIAESKDGLTWKSYSSSNILLEVGATVKYRAYIDISTDVENLDNTFELTFYLPNSSGKTNDYTFIVNKEDREAVGEEEISLDAAFANFDYSEAYEYFLKHYTDFEVMTETGLNEYINSITGRKINQIHYSFSDDGKRLGHGKGSYEFISTGDIRDDYGLINKNKWKLEGNTLILSYTTENGEHIRKCEVRTVPSKGKLLIWEGKPYAVFY